MSDDRERLALQFVIHVVRDIFKQEISDELLRETAAKVLKATYFPRPVTYGDVNER